MNTHYARRVRKLSFQQLENRLTMAGNVLGSVVSGSLYLTGDTSANAIQVLQVSSGKYIVTNTDGTTKVNGQLAPQTFSGVTLDVSINLGGGDNVVYVGYFTDNPSDPTLTVGRDLTITTGGGRDHVYVYHTNVKDDLTISSGAGNDQVYLRYVKVGFAGVDAGQNDCNINLGSNIAGNEDFLDIRHTSIARDLSVNATSTLKPTGSQYIDTQVYMDDVYVARNLTITTGDGQDYVEISNADVNGQLNIQTGNGTDGVDIWYTFANQLNVDLGYGDNDGLYIDNIVAHQASFNGGPGTGDHFLQVGNNMFDSWTLAGFDGGWKPLSTSAVDAVFSSGLMV